MAKLDARYSIAQEYTGRSGKRWVFRYCGTYISGDHTTKEDATQRALEFDAKKKAEFQAWLDAAETPADPSQETTP